METTLKKVKGILNYTVSLKEQKADIKYDSEKTDKKKIETALKSTGFKIALMEKRKTVLPDDNTKNQRE